MTASGSPPKFDSLQRWAVAITAAASLLVVLDALVVSTALTSIKADVRASVAQLEWTVNGYVLSFAVLLMTAAAVGDRYGRRRMFAAGLGVSPPRLRPARFRPRSVGSLRRGWRRAPAPRW